MYEDELDRLEIRISYLEKQNEEFSVDYQDMYNRALDLGMKFPTKQQVQTYTVEKSTAVRMYGAE